MPYRVGDRYNMTIYKNSSQFWIIYAENLHTRERGSAITEWASGDKISSGGFFLESNAPRASDLVDACKMRNLKEIGQVTFSVYDQHSKLDYTWNIVDSFSSQSILADKLVHYVKPPQGINISAIQKGIFSITYPTTCEFSKS